MLRVAQPRLTQGMKGDFHWVKGFRCAGQDGVFDQTVKFIWQRLAIDLEQTWRRSLPHRQGRHRHAVFRQGTCFVGAQHGGRAQGFNRVDVSRQHTLLRQAMRTQGRKNGHHHRILFGQDGHRQRNARQQRRQPRPIAQAQGEDHQHAQTKRDPRQHLHQLSGLLLQWRQHGFNVIQRRTNAPHLAVHACGRDAHHPLPTDHKGAAKDSGQLIATRL